MIGREQAGGELDWSKDQSEYLTNKIDVFTKIKAENFTVLKDYNSVQH